MSESVETIVIGAGQAGLATSYHLSRHEREHVVLEQGEVAHTWRTSRWDGFFLNTPNWSLQLPGHAYSGTEPDAFGSLADAIAYLDGYAAATRAPVRTGARVSSLRADGGGYIVETDGDVLRAANVVVATGAFQEPTSAPLAAAVPGDVFQLHTSEYRRPDQLPEGAVLIVGSGQSGCQIADELIESGRTVYLSVGRCPWLPRRYRGREILHWLIEIGLMDDTVETLPSPAARLLCNPPISGNDGGHDCNPRWLRDRGAVLLGRITRFRGSAAVVAPDLEENLTKGDEFVATITRRIDEHVRAASLDAPQDVPGVPQERAAPVEELDLTRAGISTILWANGFRPQFGWIDLPLVDEHGWPLQRRGVTAFPGLYFVGLHWLHKRKSALLLGVGEDAEHVVSHIVGST